MAVKALIRSVKDASYEPIQILVRQATSNAANGSDQREFEIICNHITDYVQYSLMLTTMWKRINHHKYPMHVLKGLELLSFLLHTEEEKLARDILADTRKKVRNIEVLLNYIDPKGGGHNVRAAAAEILDFLRGKRKAKSPLPPRSSTTAAAAAIPTPAPAALPVAAAVPVVTTATRAHPPSLPRPESLPLTSLAPPPVVAAKKLAAPDKSGQHLKTPEQRRERRRSAPSSPREMNRDRNGASAGATGAFPIPMDLLVGKSPMATQPTAHLFTVDDWSRVHQTSQATAAPVVIAPPVHHQSFPAFGTPNMALDTSAIIQPAAPVSRSPLPPAKKDAFSALMGSDFLSSIAPTSVSPPAPSKHIPTEEEKRLQRERMKAERDERQRREAREVADREQAAILAAERAEKERQDGYRAKLDQSRASADRDAIAAASAAAIAEAERRRKLVEDEETARIAAVAKAAADAAAEAERARLAALETERLARERAERDRLAAIEAERVAHERAEADERERQRLAALEADRLRRLAEEEAERLRLAKQAADDAERQRLEAARLAAEEAERIRLAMEAAAAAQREHDRLAAEEAERQRRLAAEEAERLRLAKAAADAAEAERLRRLAEEEAARLAALAAAAEAERLERERIERDRLAALEAERLAHERAEAEERERQRLAMEAAEQQRLAIEAAAEAERLRRLAEEEAERVRLAKAAADAAEAAARRQKEAERMDAIEEERRVAGLAAAAGLEASLRSQFITYSRYINHCLAPETLIHVTPNSTDLLAKVRDGHVLAKFINYSAPDTIDMRALNNATSHESVSLQRRDWMENLNVVLGAAKSLGISGTRGVTADKLYDADCSEDGMMATSDLVYSLIKEQMLNEAHSHLIATPPLTGISEEGRRREALPEPVINRWFADYLATQSMDEKTNGTTACLLSLMNHIRSQNGDPTPPPLATHGEAGSVLHGAQKLGIHFLPSATDLSSPRMRSAFLVAVFNQSAILERRRRALGIDRKEVVLRDDHEAYKPKRHVLTGDQREEEAFRMWINSLDLTLRTAPPRHGRKASGSMSAILTDDGKDSAPRDVYVHNLIEDSKDGLVLLAVLDRVHPGLVDWHEVALDAAGHRFKMISNCNYLVECCKKLGLSLIGVQGSDMVDGNRKLDLGLVWQLMRTHIITFLTNLQTEAAARASGVSPVPSAIPSMSPPLTGSPAPAKRFAAGALANIGHSRRVSASINSKAVADINGHAHITSAAISADSLERTLQTFANERLTRAGMMNGQHLPPGRNARRLNLFNESVLSEGLLILDLLYSIEPRLVDWRVVDTTRVVASSSTVAAPVTALSSNAPVGLTREQCILNARYAINAARKLGCVLFLCPEDIVELKGQLILTLIAAIMERALALGLE